MLEHKGLDYRYVELLAGAHPPSLWALGFRRITVPALRLRDGTRVQGSLAIRVRHRRRGARVAARRLKGPIG
jgi:glutathione S-transferase